MKILDPGTTPLTNAEVLQHIITLESTYDSPSSTRHPPPNLTSALRDVRTILEHPSQPMSSLTPNPQLADPRAFLTLTRRLRGGRFGLLQTEVLQIFNHVPRDKEKLGMVLEDAEQRFGEGEMDEMVKVIEDVLVYGKGLEDVEKPVMNGDAVKGER